MSSISNGTDLTFIGRALPAIRLATGEQYRETLAISLSVSNRSHVSETSEPISIARIPADHLRLVFKPEVADE
jgi:hypothetical protein